MISIKLLLRKVTVKLSVTYKPKRRHIRLVKWIISRISLFFLKKIVINDHCSAVIPQSYRKTVCHVSVMYPSKRRHIRPVKGTISRLFSLISMLFPIFPHIHFNTHNRSRPIKSLINPIKIVVFVFQILGTVA